MALNHLDTLPNLEGYGCAIPAGICANVKRLKSDIKDKTPSFFGGLLCHHLPMGDDGVVSYLQVGERERANALTLITREREKDEKVRHL